MYEREYLSALEKAEQIKEKFEKRKETRSARRVRTADIFAEDRSEAQFNQLERDWARGASSRGPSGRLRRIRQCRRVQKCSPPSGEAAFTIKSGRSLRREGRSNNSSINSSAKKEEEQEDEGMVGRGDFRGFHSKNPNSKYRNLISRIKKGYVSDPVMRGKMLNKTGGRWARFCCDTGCSTNIIPAKMAAAGGLKWRALDPNEPVYKSVTNEQ